MRHSIGAVACFTRLGRGRPAQNPVGKILRQMRGIADGRDEPVPSTIEDPDVLEAVRPILRASWELNRDARALLSTDTLSRNAPKQPRRWRRASSASA